MGCNCSKKADAVQYVYTAPSGTTKTYAKEIEARAAQIRNGGGTYQMVAKGGVT